MAERRSREEGALFAGLLAEGMVLALGRAHRSESLTARDKRAITKARDLFARMASTDVVLLGSQGSRMLDDGSYFDALEVVEVEANGGSIEERANRYADVLTKLLNDADRTPEDDNDIQTLRNLFSELGETVLARSTEAARAPQDVTWRPTRQATSHF
jgi:hypothetical protein